MRVTVLGTGVMGTGMIRSLVRAGHRVAAWNRTPERAAQVAGDGVTVHDDVPAAVAGADAVITMLYDGDSVLTATPQVVDALAPDAVWLQCSTIGPDGIRRVARAAGAAAPRLLDAPVLGTRRPAEDGTLTVLVSGPAPARAAAAPVLAAVGSRTLVVGDELGAASALKLACNAWVALLTAGTGQALALAEGLGVDPALFLDAVRGGQVDSPYAHVKGGAMLARRWTPVSFALDGVRKDVGLMIDASLACGLPHDLLDALLGVYERAAAAGHGGDDMAAVRTAFDAGHDAEVR